MEISQKAKTNLNGGAGEIYRAKWRLREKTISIVDFINAKYPDFPKDIVSKRYNRSEFIENFAKKIIYCLDIEITDSKLNPIHVNLADPNFRGRYWGAKGCSKISQFCYALMPFLEPVFYLKSIYLPNKYKVAGKFEAALIKKINPELSKFTSSYGFNFYDGPNIKSRILDWTKIYTPVFIRRLFRKNANPFSKLDFIKEREKLIFNNNFLIREYFNIDKISGKYMYSRALTLEYFLRNYM